MLGLASYGRPSYERSFDALYGLDPLQRYKRDETYSQPRHGTPPPNLNRYPSTPPRSSMGSPVSAWSPGGSDSPASGYRGRTPTSSAHSGSPSGFSKTPVFDTGSPYARSSYSDRDISTPPRREEPDYSTLARDVGGPAVSKLQGTAELNGLSSALTNSEAWDKWWADVTARRRDAMRRREEDASWNAFPSSQHNSIGDSLAKDKREVSTAGPAGAAGDIMQSVHSPAPASLLAKTLPAGWIDARDPTSGRVFYHNTRTGESVWEHPALKGTRRDEVTSCLYTNSYRSGTVSTPTATATATSTNETMFYSRSPRRFGRTPSMEWRSNTRFLLPPQDAEDAGKYCVVLDLDETMVYARDGPLKVRPGCRNLLRALKGKAEIVVWTAGERCYAQSVLDDLDPGREFVRHCVYRHPKWFTGKLGQVKDLRLLDRPMDKLVIVENTPDCIRSNIHNSILVSDYLGAPGDTALFDVSQVVEQLLRSGKTVPSFLQSCSQVHLSSVPTDIGDSIVVYCVGDLTPRQANQDIGSESDRNHRSPTPTRGGYGMRPYTAPPGTQMHPHLRVLKKSLT